MSLSHRIFHFSTHQYPACIAAVGNFDGGHLGHQALLHRTIKNAQAAQCASGAVLFYPSTRAYFQGSNFEPLWRLSDKLRYLKQLGLDQVICCHFNAELARLSGLAFMHILASLHVTQIVVGTQFRCGHNRSTQVHDLNHGYHQGHTSVAVDTVPSVSVGDQIVSSTRVRAALKAGQFNDVAHCLGRPYQLSVWVLKVDQKSSTQWVVFKCPLHQQMPYYPGSQFIFVDTPSTRWEQVSCYQRTITARCVTDLASPIRLGRRIIQLVS